VQLLGRAGRREQKRERGSELEEPRKDAIQTYSIMIVRFVLRQHCFQKENGAWYFELYRPNAK
jgi:hypothetical protein